MAREYSEQALKLDSDYTAAWMLVAWTHVADAIFGFSESPGDSIKRALEIEQKTSKRWPASYRHIFMNQIYFIQGQFEKAIAEGEKAVALAPNDPRNNILLAGILNARARPEEAIVYAKKAIRLEPYYPAWFVALHLYPAYDQAGRYEEALAIADKLLERALKREWHLQSAHRTLAVSYARLDRMEEAQSHAAESLKIDPNFSVKRWRTRSQSSMVKDQKWLDSIAEMMRKAGLPEHPPLKLPDKPSIAVLPFVNMSDDPKQEYFSDGITEEIITALSKTPKVFVIARNSPFTYKGKSVKVQQVGRELGVRYVLEGSVRKAGNVVRITAQLVDTKTGNHLWAERYDRDLKHIFAVQDEITLEIINALQVKLTEGEAARVTGRGTKNLDAYLKAMQAQDQVMGRAHNKENSLRVRQLAMEAISLDPYYGYPYAILAGAHLKDIWLPSTEFPEESMRLATEAAQKALTLDDSDCRIHIILGYLYVNQEKYDKAVAAAQRSVELCPGGSDAYKVMGMALDFACRTSQAIPMFEKAIKLNPLPDATLSYLLAAAYQWVGRYEDSIIEGKKALQLNPNNFLTHFVLVRTYTKLGRKEEALAEAAKVLKLNPKFSLDWYYKTVIKKMPTECHSKMYDDIEFVRKADVGLK